MRGMTVVIKQEKCCRACGEPATCFIVEDTETISLCLEHYRIPEVRHQHVTH